MKKFEFNIAISPPNKTLPHSIKWSSFIDFKYPLERWFNSIFYSLPDIKLPIGEGMKLRMSFWLGNAMISDQNILNQGKEDPTYPPQEPPLEPNPEKPTTVPEEPIYEPPEEEPNPIEPEIPPRPESTKLTLYLELLLALLTLRALSKLSLSKYAK